MMVLRQWPFNDYDLDDLLGLSYICVQVSDENYDDYDDYGNYGDNDANKAMPI